MPNTTKFVNVKCEKYSPTFSKDLTEQIKLYCKVNDINMQMFCEESMKKVMDEKYRRLIDGNEQLDFM